MRASCSGVGLFRPHLHFDPQAEVATAGFGKEEVEDAGADTLLLELEGDVLVAVAAVGDGEELAGVGVQIGYHRVGPPDEVSLFSVFQFLPRVLESCGHDGFG